MFKDFEMAIESSFFGAFGVFLARKLRAPLVLQDLAEEYIGGELGPYFFRG